MLQFAPQRMARHDAEIAADVGDDGADRATAYLGSDLLRRRQADPRVYPRIKSGGGDKGLAEGGGVGGPGGGGSGRRPAA
jgi:hypothetical protein